LTIINIIIIIIIIMITIIIITSIQGYSKPNKFVMQPALVVHLGIDLMI